MKEILISVIVPIFNVEKYLKSSLQSLQIQTLQEFEVLMIDDGSEDGSADIAKFFSYSDDRFKYYRQDNKGLSASRNEGLKRAKGKYIIFLDSDDTLENEALEYLYNLAEKNKLEFIIYSGYMEFYDKFDINIEKVKPCGNFMNIECNNGTELYEKLRLNNSYFTGVPFQLVRRDVLERAHIEFLEGIIHEDHLYTFQILNSVHKCMAIDYRFYHYKKRNNSITKGTKYRERLTGFAVTFIEMIQWISKSDKTGLKNNNTVIRHINEIWIQVVKYIIFIKRNDCPYKILNDFKNYSETYYKSNNIRHYVKYYYPLLRIMHYMVFPIKSIKSIIDRNQEKEYGNKGI